MSQMNNYAVNTGMNTPIQTPIPTVSTPNSIVPYPAYTPANIPMPYAQCQNCGVLVVDQHAHTQLHMVLTQLNNRMSSMEGQLRVQAQEVDSLKGLFLITEDAV